MAESIAKRLKRLRLEKKLSQRDLSSPGVSYAYISRIEAGARTPSVKAIRKLAAKLGVTPEYLETGQDVTRWRLPWGLTVQVNTTDQEIVELIESAMRRQGIAAERASP